MLTLILLESEQKGKRWGLVVSNNTYHKNTNDFAIVVPITNSKSFNYPLHVALDKSTKTLGEMMCEQLKTIDTKVINLKVEEKAPNNILEKVLKIISLLF